MLWYLVMLLGLYALIPVVSIFTKKASRKEQGYLLALLFVVVSVLQTIIMIRPVGVLLELNVQRLSLSFPGIFVFFLIAGDYFARNVVKGKNKWLLISAALLSMVTIAVHSFLAKEKLELNYTPLVIYTLAVFVLVSDTQGRLKGPAKKLIGNIADCTFGIYLVHTFVQYGLRLCGAEQYLFSMPWQLGIACYVVILFALSWGLTVLLRLVKLGRMIT